MYVFELRFVFFSGNMPRNGIAGPSGEALFFLMTLESLFHVLSKRRRELNLEIIKYSQVSYLHP